MSSYQYRKSHYGDKTILRPSYLHNGISYTGKTISLYWIRSQGICGGRVNSRHRDLIKVFYSVLYNPSVYIRPAHSMYSERRGHLTYLGFNKMDTIFHTKFLCTYLNQCSLIISQTPWNIPWYIFVKTFLILILISLFENHYVFTVIFPRNQWVDPTVHKHIHGLVVNYYLQRSCVRYLTHNCVGDTLVYH